MNPNQPNSLNMIPPSLGQSRIPNLDALYNNVQVTSPIGTFNFAHNTPTNPYLLANILSSAQPSILNHGSISGHFGQSLNQMQMYDNFIYHQQQQQQQQQQNNHTFERSSSSNAALTYGDAKRFAAAAHYSPILPPFLAAAAASTCNSTNMMLANAFIMNSYGNSGCNNSMSHNNHNSPGYSQQGQSLVDAAEIPPSPAKLITNETYYLPSPASNKSSLSACDAKSLDRSPFAHPCGPGSHSDVNVNSPSAMSCQITPSTLSFQSPAVPDRSPAASVVSPTGLGINSNIRSNTVLAFHGSSSSVLSRPPSQPTNTFQHYLVNPASVNTIIAGENSAKQRFNTNSTVANPKADNLVLASVSASLDINDADQKSHFFTDNIDGNSKIMPNVGIDSHCSAINTAMGSSISEDPFSVLSKDVNLDLTVSHQFWEDLGDSVLDDALLSAAAGQEEAGVVGQSLLHSVFEFPSLQSVASFDDMVTGVDNSIKNFDVDHTPSGSSSAQRVTSTSEQPISTSWLKMDHAQSSTLKEKRCSWKEKELAEIDREFARHFNAIVQKDFIQNSPSQTTSLKADQTTTIVDASLEKLACDIDFSSSAKYRTFPSLDRQAYSPILFDRDQEDQDCTDNLMVKFSHLSKYFVSLSPKVCRSSQQRFGLWENDTTSSSHCSPINAAEKSNNATDQSTKWAPRKSKRVPIYKQQQQLPTSRPSVEVSSVRQTFPAFSTSTPAIPRVTSCDPKRLSMRVSLKPSGSLDTHDSPFSFTEEDEGGTALDQPSTSLSDVKHETLERHSHLSGSGSSTRSKMNMTSNRRQKPTILDRASAGANSAINKNVVDEKVLEEEVNRKLLQISSLHPELRLAIATGGKNCSITANSSTNDERHDFTTFTQQTIFDQQDASVAFPPPYGFRPTGHGKTLVVDDLRHVIPKKRLSSRQNLTPPPLPTSSATAPVLPPPRNSSANGNLDHVPCSYTSSSLKPFVCTRVISDTETAKPVNFSHKAVPVQMALLENTRSNALDKTSNAMSIPVQYQTPIEPLKPKLILRIPKRCLSTEAVNEPTPCLSPSSIYDLDTQTLAKRHKHKKKKKRERLENLEQNTMILCKKRKHLDSSASFQAPDAEHALISSSLSEGNNCINSADDKKCTAESLDPAEKLNSLINTHPNNSALNKNRKKMRWLQPSEDETCNVTSAPNAETFAEINNNAITGPITESSLLENSNVRPLDHTPIFQKGAFVVYKSDLSRTDCPIWRVDSQNLLQKFVPSEQDCRNVYQGSSTYAGWCPQNQDLFVAVHVKNLHHSRHETTVQLENPITDLFPAISCEISDGFDRSMMYSIKADNNSSISFELDHPLKEALQTYVHILIVHSILGNYLQVLKLRNETTLLEKMNEVDALNNEKKKKLSKDACWVPKFEDALEWYPYCTINEDDGSGLHCQACGKNVVENVLQLFANEGYDFETLVPQQPKTTISGSPIPSQDFHVCPSCADIAVLYHKLTHMRYHLYRQCLDKTDLVKGDNTEMEPAVIIENCLVHNSWIVTSLQEYVNIWSKIS